MLQNNFFETKGPFTLKELFPNQKIDLKLEDVKPLNTAQKSDITFLDSIRYKNQAINTKATCCITTEKLKK